MVGLAEELEVDLIIVGSKGRGASAGAVMSSGVSNSVVRHARRPVVVVRSQVTGVNRAPGLALLVGYRGSEKAVDRTLHRAG